MTTTITTGQLHHLDPTTLHIAANIRSVAELDPDFRASIKELGVLVPIVAVVGPDGEILVRRGQRRTLAAVDAARETVPVYVTDEDQADEVARIVTQWAENEHRAALSNEDKAAAIEQLALLGVSAAQIAKRTRADRTEVDKTLGAAKLPEPVRPLVMGDALTLDQAAELAEFEDDPKAYARLIKKLSAGGWGATTAIAEERRKRETNAEKADVLADLRGRDVRVIGAPREWDYPRKTRMQPISNLLNAKGKKITPSAHARCKGHAAFLRIEQYRPAGQRITVHYVCADPEEHGHTLAEQYRDRDSGPTLTEAELAAQAEQDETTRVEWAAATDGRWQWLVSLFRTKQLPDALARAALGSEQPHNYARVLHLLTGSPADEDADQDAIEDAYAAQLAKEPIARLHRHTVAYCAAAIESQAYRLDPTEQHSWTGGRVADWLRLLAAIGYQLSDVERTVSTTWPAEDEPDAG